MLEAKKLPRIWILKGSAAKRAQEHLSCFFLLFSFSPRAANLLEGSRCSGSARGGDGQVSCMVGFRAGEHSDIYKCMVNGTRRSSGIASLLGFA